MSLSLMTYNFCLDENRYKSNPDMIHSTLKDKRNGITTCNLIPGMQSYINYLELLVQLRDRWISTGYLDLGMIPIIVGPSFMHEVLVTNLLPVIQSKGLKVMPMPATSFMLQNTMQGSTDYWAFRDDVAKFLGCDPDRVTTKAVISELTGVELE